MKGITNIISHKPFTDVCIENSLYVNPELDIMPLDSFHILLEADLFFSRRKLEGELDIDTTNLFGSNYENSNIYRSAIQVGNRL